MTQKHASNKIFSQYNYSQDMEIQDIDVTLYKLQQLLFGCNYEVVFAYNMCDRIHGIIVLYANRPYEEFS